MTIDIDAMLNQSLNRDNKTKEETVNKAANKTLRDEFAISIAPHMIKTIQDFSLLKDCKKTSDVFDKVAVFVYGYADALVKQKEQIESKKQ